MRRAVSLLLLGMACWAAGAPPVRAAYDPVASGATSLSLDPGFRHLLRQAGVRISAVAPATLRGGVATFPVSGGKFDPVDGKGTVEHDGALVLSRAGSSIPLKALQLKTSAPRAPFSAKLGGGQLKLLRAASLEVSRQGFGDRVSTGSLRLSAKVATRLAKKLDMRGVLKAGQLLGEGSTRIQPEGVTLLPSGRAELALDPAFEAKLASLFVAVNPIFPAEHPGPFTFPIGGGRIAPNGSAGALSALGSLEFLQLGGAQVFWSAPSLDLGAATFSPEVDTEPSPPYGGKVGSVVVAHLGGGAFTADPEVRTLHLSAASLALDAATAAAFDDAFAKPEGRQGVFAGGEPIGTVSFSARGQ